MPSKGAEVLPQQSLYTSACFRPEGQWHQGRRQQDGVCEIGRGSETSRLQDIPEIVLEYNQHFTNREINYSSATHPCVLALRALESPLSETAQHYKRHFPTGMALRTAILKEVVDSIALARRPVYTGVGIARVDGKSRVKPE